jgi:hypothetical protein
MQTVNKKERLSDRPGCTNQNNRKQTGWPFIDWVHYINAPRGFELHVADDVFPA